MSQSVHEQHKDPDQEKQMVDPGYPFGPGGPKEHQADTSKEGYQEEPPDADGAEDS